jgi:hypothetical protein
MPDNYSISLQGIYRAEAELQRAAQNIASGRSRTRDDAGSLSSDVLELSGADATAGADPVDYTKELVAVMRAKIALKSNLKAIQVQESVDRDALEMLKRK